MRFASRLAPRIRAARQTVLDSEQLWLGVYLLIAAIATGVCVAKQCNNFLIFRSAYSHLLGGRDLYASYPAEHADLYKYSPTFALLFAPLARLPFGIALLGWNLLNVLLIFQSIRLAVPEGRRLEAIQLGAIGLVGTVDGTQSNGVVAAMIVLAFVALERNRLSPAAAAIGIGALIKLFPLAAVLFALRRKDRWRFGGALVTVGAILLALPLTVVGASVLAREYLSWYHVSAADALDRGASIMRLLQLGAGYTGPNWPIQLGGTVLLVLPLLAQRSRWDDADFRMAFLGSVLIYAVIFNHKAEQPSFIIAVVGLAIWHATSPRSMVRSVVTGCAFAATIPILMTVIAPGMLARSVNGPLLVESGCCCVAWFTLQGELLDLFPERVESEEPDFGAMSDEPAV